MRPQPREIPRTRVLERLRLENPWWGTDDLSSAPFAKFRPRAYRADLFRLVRQLDVHRAVVVMGPRRVGKTVLLHHIIQKLIRTGVPRHDVCYASVDHPLYTTLDLEEFLRAFQESRGEHGPHGTHLYMFFDEIQYLPEWEVELKVFVDSHPEIKVVASGSAAAALRLKSLESGAGRFTDFLLPPLTFSEYLDLVGHHKTLFPRRSRVPVCASVDRLNQLFLEYLNFGGYPESALNDAIRMDPGRYIKSDIVDKVLLRDLPQLYGIQNIQELNSLFTRLAFNTGNVISLDALSKESGVAKNTISKYMEYLQAAFLIKRIERIDRSAKHFKRATSFKVYLANPSMWGALFTPITDGDPAIGSLVETAVFAQWMHWDDLSLYFANWNSGEIDMVYLNPMQKPGFAVEVGWSDHHIANPRELDAVVDFCVENSIRRALVTTKTEQGSMEIRGVRVDYIPTAIYAYQVGRNIIRSKRHREFPAIRELERR